MAEIPSDFQQREIRDDWGQHFEMLTARIYCEFVTPGSVVVDGGANSGMHTIPLARAVGDAGKVIAVEPQGNCICNLCKWLDNQELRARVEIREGILSERSGVEDFWINTQNNAMSAKFVEEACLETWKKIQVDAFTIDELRADRRVSFIKLDLEGGEYHAIRGASNTLKSDRPLIVFENSGQHAAEVNGYRVSDFIQDFDEYGYQVFDFMGKEIREAQLSLPSVFPWYFVAGSRGSRELRDTRALCVDYFGNISTHYRDWQTLIKDISEWSRR